MANHRSHGLGEHLTGRPGTNHKGDITRMAPKHVHDIEVNSGMHATPRSGGDALSGHHASAIDALSGAAVVPGAVKTVPGWGNAGVQSGHPFAKPPGAKRTIIAQPVIGHRSRTSQHSADLGEAILKTAFSRSDSADCIAHGRNPLDGSK